VNLQFARGLTDDDVAALAAAAPALREADLGGTQAVGDAAVLALARHCHRLRSLNLYWNVRLSGAALRGLAASPCAAHLQRLCLSGCKALDDASLAALLAAAPCLTSIDLTRCLALGDGALRALAAAPCAPRVTELVLYADAQFGSTALGDALAACGESLTRLDVCGIPGADDAALLRLAATGGLSRGGCSAPLPLRTLNLSWCTALRDAGLLPLLRRAHALRWLSVHGNRLLSCAVLDALESCSADSLTALDVRGCTAMGDAAARAPAELRRRLPRLAEFALHS
jgi:hypothetical protein